MRNKIGGKLARLFVFAALGTGAGALHYKAHDAESYQERYPSISAQDAQSLRKETAETYAGVIYGIGIASVLGMFRRIDGKDTPPPAP